MKKLLTILCLVLLVSCSPSPSPSPEVPTNKLVERQGITYQVNSEIPFTGTLVEFYENGQHERKVDYKNGKPHGLSQSFYENGEIDERGHFKNGKKEGLYEDYHTNGQLSSTGNYIEDILIGRSEYFHDNGEKDYTVYGKWVDGKYLSLRLSVFEEGSWSCYVDGWSVEDPVNSCRLFFLDDEGFTKPPPYQDCKRGSVVP
jgi:hypothetical protein